LFDWPFWQLDDFIWLGEIWCGLDAAWPVRICLFRLDAQQFRIFLSRYLPEVSDLFILPAFIIVL